MKQKFLPTVLKGFTIGSSMLVPGVSGGTMAIMLNIYSDLIEAISSFRSNWKQTLKFLTIFCLGAGVGMLLLARPLLYLVESFPMPMMYFFIGAVAGSIPLIYHQSGVTTLSIKTVVYPCIGLGIVVLMGFLPQDLIPQNANSGWLEFLILLLAGFIIAIALILPGISVSHMLLMLGIYARTMEALSNLQILYLIPLGIGLLLGILTATKLIDKLMARFPQGTYLVILGFIIGSVLQVFPGIPNGWELLICPILFAVGFYTMHRISLLERR